MASTTLSRQMKSTFREERGKRRGGGGGKGRRHIEELEQDIFLLSEEMLAMKTLHPSFTMYYYCCQSQATKINKKILLVPCVCVDVEGSAEYLNRNPRVRINRKSTLPSETVVVR